MLGCKPEQIRPLHSLHATPLSFQSADIIISGASLPTVEIEEVTYRRRVFRVDLKPGQGAGLISEVTNPIPYVEFRTAGGDVYRIPGTIQESSFDFDGLGFWLIFQTPQ